MLFRSSSPSRAEELINTLRETIGSLPLVPLKAKNTAQHSMTHWLKTGHSPADFSLGGECELRDSADASAVIRCKNQNLDSAEIRNHLESGMYASRLELAWQGGIECVVDDKLAVKRLRFTDLIMDRVKDVETESAAEQFDVDFSLMTGEFARFIPALVAAFGGPEESQ